MSASWRSHRFRAADSLLVSEDSICRPRGMNNLGNTCFINSISQVLAHLCTKMTPTCTGDDRSCCILCLMLEVKEKTTPYTGSVVPRRLVNLIRDKYPEFHAGHQGDAHDVYVRCLNSFRNKQCSVEYADMFWCKMLYKRECLACNYVQEREQKFKDITIAVEKNELLAGLEQYVRQVVAGCKCSNCDSKAEALLTYSFTEPPPILVFTLNNGSGSRKLSKQFEVQPRIDIAPYSSFTKEECWYRLTGVVFHDGNLYAGHYWSAIKGEDNSWIRCNDSLVDVVTEEQMIRWSQSAGRMFFYIPDKEYGD